MWMTGLTKYRDFGLLVLRIGLGAAFMMHGQPKLWGGVESWEGLGKAVAVLGLDVGSLGFKVFGFLAALAEFFGGICLLLGFCFRPALLMLLATMAVAITMHVHKGDGFNGWSHAAESAAVFFALMFIGPGRFSIDRS